MVYICAMPIKRKCPACNTWNGEESHCVNCGKTLDPELLREEADLKRAKERAPSAGQGLDEFFDGMKNSKWLLVKGAYWVGYSVWFVFFSILASLYGTLEESDALAAALVIPTVLSAILTGSIAYVLIPELVAQFDR